MPDRILNRIKDTHGGSLEEKRFGKRMRGEGHIADIIHQQFRIAREKFMKDRNMPEYDLTLYERFKGGQLSLFHS